MNILGAGITGLLLGYLTNSPVYGMEVGGQLKGFQKGPRILELDKNTIKLLSDLGIEDKPEVFKVGYMNQLGAKSTIFPQERDAYYEKTRGIKGKAPASVLSEGKSSIVGWDLNKIDLIDKLTDQVRIIPGRVTGINFAENKVSIDTSTGSTTLPVDECISTINLLTTIRLIRHNPVEIFYLYPDEHKNIRKSIDSVMELDLSSYDTTFVTSPITHDLALNHTYSYVYNVDITNPINRITFIDNQDMICFEFRGDKFGAAVDAIEAMNGQIHSVSTIRFCQLQHDQNVLELGLDREGLYHRRLRLCGRYANWTHAFKINSVFERAEEYVKSMGR